ncbi:MAG: sulfur carrier protein ThiS [Campylobacterales bacterium]
MNVIVNGEERQIAPGSTLLQLIDALGIEGKVMACALNMEIVKRDAWAATTLSEDDRIELLQFVGGG